MRIVFSIVMLSLFVVGCQPKSRGLNPPPLADDTTQEPTDEVPEPIDPVPTPIPVPVDTEAEVLKKYAYLDPGHMVPTKHLRRAILIYDANKSFFKNKSVFSIIDFSQFSGNKRFYIIDLASGYVWAIRTSHGKGSDPDHDGYANSFSNVSGSNATSLGVYRTAETYIGSHGYSLRLDGMSSTNSNARARAIVLHGADYVKETNVIQGRSWGCPAVAMSNRDAVVDLLKGGSMIFAVK